MNYYENLLYENVINILKLQKNMSTRLNMSDYEDFSGNSFMSGHYLHNYYEYEEQIERLKIDGKLIAENVDTDKRNYIILMAKKNFF